MQAKIVADAIIGGKYKLGKRIGSGSFGVVHAGKLTVLILGSNEH